MGSANEIDEEDASALETAVIRHREALLAIAARPSTQWISSLNAEHERHFKDIVAILFKMQERRRHSDPHHN